METNGNVKNGDYVYVMGDDASVKECVLVERDGDTFKIEHCGEHYQYDKNEVFESIDDCIRYMRKLEISKYRYTVYSYCPF